MRPGGLKNIKKKRQEDRGPGGQEIYGTIVQADKGQKDRRRKGQKDRRTEGQKERRT